VLERWLNQPAVARMTAAADAVHGAADAQQQQQLLWYFAYGSMCNPVSLSRRELFPTASHPASLAGYRVAFELGKKACWCCEVDKSAPCAHSVMERDRSH
jgi:hypothetical protein